jgi:hypothetical protein
MTGDKERRILNIISHGENRKHIGGIGSTGKAQHFLHENHLETTRE